LVQNTSDIITILDADGTIDYISPAVERVTGYKPEEQIGTDAFRPVHPDDREQALSIFAEVLKSPGLHPPLEFRMPHKDGSWRYLEHVVNNLLEDPAVRGVVVTYWGIGRCSWTASNTPLFVRIGGATRSRCYLRTWTTSRSLTTAWGTK
jgi:PAS domain S-box-containing protein